MYSVEETAEEKVERLRVANCERVRKCRAKKKRLAEEQKLAEEHPIFKVSVEQIQEVMSHLRHVEQKQNAPDDVVAPDAVVAPVAPASASSSSGEAEEEQEGNLNKLPLLIKKYVEMDNDEYKKAKKLVTERAKVQEYI